MSDMEIRKEGLPVRCEVCHQDDQFNRETSYCTRCAKVTVPKEIMVKKPLWQRIRREVRITLMAALILGMMSLISYAINRTINYRKSTAIIEREMFEVKDRQTLRTTEFRNIFFVAVEVSGCGDSSCDKLTNGLSGFITIGNKNDKNLLCKTRLWVDDFSCVSLYDDIGYGERSYAIVVGSDVKIHSIELHLESAYIDKIYNKYNK